MTIPPEVIEAVAKAMCAFQKGWKDCEAHADSYGEPLDEYFTNSCPNYKGLATAAITAYEQATTDHYEPCAKCGLKFDRDHHVPDEVWDRIKPDNSQGGGLLCGQCIVDALVATAPKWSDAPTEAGWEGYIQLPEMDKPTLAKTYRDDEGCLRVKDIDYDLSYLIVDVPEGTKWTGPITPPEGS